MNFTIFVIPLKFKNLSSLGFTNIVKEKRFFFPFPSPTATDDVKLAYQKLKEIENLLNHNVLPRPSEIKRPKQHINLPTIKEINSTIHPIHSSLIHSRRTLRHINSPKTNKIPIQDTNATIHSFEDTNGTIHNSPSCSHIHNKYSESIVTIRAINFFQQVTIHAKDKGL